MRRKGAFSSGLLPLQYLDHGVIHVPIFAALTYRRMVNVNANLPFNLHNKALHDQLEPSSSPSVRSRSAHAVMGGFSESASEILHEPHSRMQSCSPTRGRDLSPSLETSRSNTSLHPGDASYLPPEADPEGGSRRPILNMRLVRGAGGYGVGDGFRTRKGRDVPRGRVGRFAEDSGSDAPESNGVEDSAAHAQAVSADSESLTRVNEDSYRRRSPDATFGSPGENASTPLATAFAVRDVGKITCSWGD